MQIEPFALERYFARHEFSARYLLSCSDCEPLPMAELLAMADGEALDLWHNLRLAYTESTGHPLLRQAIAGLYRDTAPEQVLTAVPEEAIFLFMHSVLQAGDQVVCTFPGYQSLFAVAASLGCSIGHWQPREEGRWHFDPDDLEQLITPETRLVVVNFPHNPTGALLSKDAFSRVVELCRERGLWLFCDEMYRCLELDRPDPLPAGCECYERAVSLSGLSKAYGLPGLRTGWVVSRDRDLLARMGQLKDYTTICGSAPGEILALIGLRNRERIIGDHLERLRNNREVLGAFVRRQETRFSWIPPRGGSICLLKLHFTTDARGFCDHLVAGSGIMLVPSELFRFGGCHVRIGLGRRDFPEVLDRFEACLEQYLPVA